jgi:hypothetical protein
MSSNPILLKKQRRREDASLFQKFREYSAFDYFDGNFIIGFPVHSCNGSSGDV